jgi:S-adenosylmethionine:diacylglycerol 3-amino-3-carboxypropyl transferase
MDFLYNYGMSQEDALTECNSLELVDNDSLLCIASAGEIPLNIASMRNIKITATDTSADQLRLCRIKLSAALSHDALTAAAFLGYMGMQEDRREKIFRREIMENLCEDDRKFWNKNPDAIKRGVVNSGRFEKYMLKVTGIGRLIVGRANLYSLFECNSIEEQKELFDKRINGLAVKGIFRIAFHPWLYKNRGIDPAGLTHSGARNIGEFFFRRFRSFCCNTLSRENYFLQYTFFNRILFPEALPEFLQPSLHNKLSDNCRNIEFVESSLEKILDEADPGKYNKIHISNIGDWMSGESMAEVFRLLRDKTLPGGRISMRYIHLNHKLPVSVPELVADNDLGNDLIQRDRYPFYSLVPIIRK